MVYPTGPSSLEVVQFSSVVQSYPPLYDPVDCSMPGFPVHHQLPELAQTHVHQVDDGIHTLKVTTAQVLVLPPKFLLDLLAPLTVRQFFLGLTWNLSAWGTHSFAHGLGLGNHRTGFTGNPLWGWWFSDHRPKSPLEPDTLSAFSHQPWSPIKRSLTILGPLLLSSRYLAGSFQN